MKRTASSSIDGSGSSSGSCNSERRNKKRRNVIRLYYNVRACRQTQLLKRWMVSLEVYQEPLSAYQLELLRRQVFR